MPDVPPTIRARDEAFWQRHEARRDKQLGQPCCTQSGMSWAMIDMPGDFAVVIHGEFDCVNCFHHHLGRSAANFYTTRLSEQQIITGQTQEPLRRCLRLIAAERRPEAVIVLGTCPVEVIGDRFETVVASVAAETGVPMIALHTSGLSLSSQAAMLDWLYTELASLPTAPAQNRAWQRDVAALALDLLDDASGEGAIDALRQRLDAQRTTTSLGRVNLVATPTGEVAEPEPVRLLANVGLTVNGVYPNGASVRDWRSIGHASASVVVDPSMFPRFIKRLQGMGQAILPAPLPVGLGATRAFYDRIGRHFGITDAMDAALAPIVAPLEDATARLRERAQGRKAVVAIRMLNTFAADQLAYEGLGEVAFLEELGLDVHVLVQGPPEQRSHDAFAARLAELGFTLPFRIFRGPFELREILREGRYDLGILPDSARGQARDAGLAMLAARSLPAWFRGVPAALDRLARQLDGRPA